MTYYIVDMRVDHEHDTIIGVFTTDIKVYETYKNHRCEAFNPSKLPEGLNSIIYRRTKPNGYSDAGMPFENILGEMDNAIAKYHEYRTI